jgi:hypothetical protein
MRIAPAIFLSYGLRTSKRVNRETSELFERLVTGIEAV